MVAHYNAQCFHYVFSNTRYYSNNVADLLSRWSVISNNIDKLHKYIQDPIWIKAHIDLTLLTHST